jgi:truncated hemoglobin YjbI
MNDPIASVVEAFYRKATTDVIIGYHFRKIAQEKALNQGHPLRPPIEAFKDHLPRIEHFWRAQLLNVKVPNSERPFDLIGIHQELKIRKGELHRWLTLFRETLNEELIDETYNELKTKWLEKLENFENVFLKSPKLFKQNS